MLSSSPSRSPLAPSVAFLDLDGTVTRDGSLFRGTSAVTLDGALALARLLERGVEIVPSSGRTIASLRETARLLGARAFIAELGSALAFEGGASVLRVAAGPDANELRQSGVAEAIFKSFPLEWHAPWHETREYTLLMRGNVETERVRAFIADVFPKLDLDFVDNGEVSDDGTRAYHVLPRGVGKRAAIERFLEVRRIPRDAAVSFGDSEGDLEMAGAVGRHYWIGGPEGRHVADNVRVTTRRFGEGLLEAVSHLLDAAPEITG